MIIQFNPNKLCKQAFFMEIVNYLYLNQPVTLRAIKREFPFQKNIDKLIEEFVKAGYIERFEKRYRLLISLVSDSSKIDLDQHFFINDNSSCYLELLNRSFVTKISNSTNDVVIIEQTGITRDVLQKRRNIFVDALVLLGYLVQVEEGRYLLNMDLDSEAFVFSAKKD